MTGERRAHRLLHPTAPDCTTMSYRGETSSTACPALLNQLDDPVCGVLTVRVHLRIMHIQIATGVAEEVAFSAVAPEPIGVRVQQRRAGKDSLENS